MASSDSTRPAPTIACRGRLALFGATCAVVLAVALGAGARARGQAPAQAIPDDITELELTGSCQTSECHADMDVNYERRELEMFHEDIQLDHGPEERWCFDCHNAVDRDHLRLVSGELVGFDESYRLCGQCHGTIFRDWREGIHGQRRGYWNGAKSYLLCAHCHNPHAPAFQPLEPLPPPVRPQFLGQTHEEEPGS